MVDNLIIGVLCGVAGLLVGIRIGNDMVVRDADKYLSIMSELVKDYVTTVTSTEIEQRAQLYLMDANPERDREYEEGFHNGVVWARGWIHARYVRLAKEAAQENEKIRVKTDES